MCYYCRDVFGNGGIKIKPQYVKGKKGKWHKRIDNRFVPCSGEIDQTPVRMVIDNLIALEDCFEHIIVCATGQMRSGGFYVATSQTMEVRLYNDMVRAFGTGQPTPLGEKLQGEPSSPLISRKKAN